MDRRTFLKASGAAVAVAAMPSLPAFGSVPRAVPEPSAFTELSTWAASRPNIMGYVLAGSTTPEFTIAGDGTYVGVFQSLREYGHTADEACESLRTSISAYIGPGDPMIWWRFPPMLSENWTDEEGRGLSSSVFIASCRAFAFSSDNDFSVTRREGNGLRPHEEAEFGDICARASYCCRIWGGDPPPGAVILAGDAGEAANVTSDWTTGKVVLPKRGTAVDRFQFLGETAA